MVAFFLVLLPLAASLPVSGLKGAAWTGDMHPGIGFSSNPECNHTTLQGCAPTYSTLETAQKLWACPAGTQQLPTNIVIIC